MKIVVQLKVIIISTIIIIGLLFSLLINSYNNYKTSKRNYDFIGELENQLFERISLRDQYLIYHEKISSDLWLKRDTEFEIAIKSISGKVDRLEEEIYQNILTKRQESRELFQRILKNAIISSTPGANKEIYSEFDKRLFSQMLIKAGEIRDHLLVIKTSLSRKLENNYRTLLSTIVLMILSLCFVIILISLRFSLLISKQINSLLNGMESISKGDLNFKLKIISDDEFGQLGKSINLMTVKLQELNIQVENERIKSIQSSKLAALGEMSAGIAHEINNPLSVIQGNAKLLLKNLQNNELLIENLAEYLEKIHSNCLRISKIISGLKSITRQADNDSFIINHFDSILNEVLPLFNHKIIENNIKLEVNYLSSDLIILCSRTQISQVLVNLLNNAIDASASLSDQWIKINVVKNLELGILQFSIIDSGHGISKINLDKIMVPFFTTKESNKGTGLGLSISRSIIEKHRGRLFLDEKTINTYFIFEIPLAIIQT